MFSLTHLIAAAEAAGATESLAQQFGVDWPYFLSQLLNFLIVGAALYFFAVKPLTKTLDARREKIESGLRYADEMKARTQAAEKERGELLKQASQAAQAVVQKAAEQGRALLEKQTREASEQAEALLKKAREQTALEHAKMMGEVRREAADLVVRATSAVLQRDLPQAERDRVAREAAEAVSK